MQECAVFVKRVKFMNLLIIRYKYTHSKIFNYHITNILIYLPLRSKT